MKGPQFWQDLAGTIPAELGDKVALATNVDGHGAIMRQTDETLRPTVVAGFGGITGAAFDGGDTCYLVSAE